MDDIKDTITTRDHAIQSNIPLRTEIANLKKKLAEEAEALKHS